MIFPARLAIVLAVIGAPLAAVVGAFVPALWPLGLLWVVILASLIMADAFLGANRWGLAVELTTPAYGHPGEPLPVRIDARFASGRAPQYVDVRLETDDLLKPLASLWRSRTLGGLAIVDAAFDVRRRGEGEIRRIWLEWRGPLRLVVKRRIVEANRNIPIIIDLKGVKSQALRLFARDTSLGSRDYIQKGEGSEFEALREFMPGMDRRTIDWKQSARHIKLLAKEFRTEQDQTVVFAIDTGRLMCEPVGKLPKIDHAINAAMLLAYVGLKMGDRVGLFGFDAKPHVLTAPQAGVNAFPLIQRSAARLEYSNDETNFTLGLSQLASSVGRRSLIVIFTDFADPTSAELMVENVGRLVGKHLVVFVAIKDQELEDITTSEPARMLDVTRAVIAQSLLQERELVLSRLQRLGVEIVDATAQQLGPDLLNKYLDLKRASRI